MKAASLQLRFERTICVGERVFVGTIALAQRVARQRLGHPLRLRIGPNAEASPGYVARRPGVGVDREHDGGWVVGVQSLDRDLGSGVAPTCVQRAHAILKRAQPVCRQCPPLMHVRDAQHVLLLEPASRNSNIGNQPPWHDANREPNPRGFGVDAGAHVGEASAVRELSQDASHQIGGEQLANARVLDQRCRGPATALGQHLDARDGLADVGR